MVKTRLQAASKQGQYAGPIDVFKQIIQKEGGFRALYRGLAPNLVGVTPEKAIKLVRNIENKALYVTLSYGKYLLGC